MHGARRSAFTSGLSTNEFVLARQNGFRPLAQVLGASVHKIGYRGNPRSGPLWPGYPNAGYVELTSPTRAWNTARRNALERLRDGATACAADLVAGVSIDCRVVDDSGAGTIELVVRGTALRADVAPADRPVLTTLTGQELAALAGAGYRAAGILTATTVTYVLSGYRTSYARSGPRRFENRELPDLSHGAVVARKNVFARLDEQRRGLVADGLVGVRYEQSVELEPEVEDLVVTLHVTGTAIARRPSPRARLDALPLVRLDAPPHE